MKEKGKSSRYYTAGERLIFWTSFIGIGADACGVIIQKPGTDKTLAAFLPNTEKRCFSTPPFDT